MYSVLLLRRSSLCPSSPLLPQLCRLLNAAETASTSEENAEIRVADNWGSDIGVENDWGSGSDSEATSLYDETEDSLLDAEA